MHLILVFSSCLLVLSINLAFKTGQYVAGNLLLVMLITSVFRHSTNSMYHDTSTRKLQYIGTYYLDLSVVHIVGIFDFFYILFNFNLRRLFAFILFSTIPFTYWLYLSKIEKYKLKQTLVHSIGIHYLGTSATMLMLAPSIKDLYNLNY